jgi:hypothetical protein
MDGFTVSREEWDAVQAFLQTQSPDEVARVRHQEKTLPWPGAEEAGVSDVTVTYCRFRDTEQNRCSVYPARPTICRLFGQTHWLPCPIGAVAQYPEDAPQVWNHYREFDRRTFAQWEADETQDKQNVPNGLQNF